MVNAFYISNGGDAQGPYEMGQLRSMWNAGQLTANTLYWNADSEEWRGISELRLGEAEAKSAARPEASLNLAGSAKATEAACAPPAAIKSDSLAPSQWVLIIGAAGFFVWMFVDSMWGKPWIMWVAAPLLLVGIAVIGHLLWGLFILSGAALTDRNFWRANKWKAASLLALVAGVFGFILMPERILGDEAVKEHGIKVVYAVIALGAAALASLAWVAIKANRRKSG